MGNFNFFSEELSDSIKNIQEGFLNRVQTQDIQEIGNLNDAIDKAPILGHIARLKSIEENIEMADADRSLIQTFIHVYSRVIDELDQKITTKLNELGDKLPYVMELISDGGFSLFSRFFY